MQADRAGALAELATAREVVPQLARHHPMVRETLDVLARTSRRSSEQLRQLASWVGLSWLAPQPSGAVALRGRLSRAGRPARADHGAQQVAAAAPSTIGMLCRSCREPAWRPLLQPIIEFSTLVDL